MCPCHHARRLGNNIPLFSLHAVKSANIARSPRKIARNFSKGLVYKTAFPSCAGSYFLYTAVFNGAIFSALNSTMMERIFEDRVSGPTSCLSVVFLLFRRVQTLS